MKVEFFKISGHIIFHHPELKEVKLTEHPATDKTDGLLPEKWEKKHFNFLSSKDLHPCSEAGNEDVV